MLLQVNAHFEEGEIQDVDIPPRTYLTRASYLARHQFFGLGGRAGFSSALARRALRNENSPTRAQETG